MKVSSPPLIIIEWIILFSCGLDCGLPQQYDRRRRNSRLIPTPCVTCRDATRERSKRYGQPLSLWHGTVEIYSIPLLVVSYMKRDASTLRCDDALYTIECSTPFQEIWIAKSPWLAGFCLVWIKTLDRVWLVPPHWSAESNARIDSWLTSLTTRNPKNFSSINAGKEKACQ